MKNYPIRESDPAFCIVFHGVQLEYNYDLVFKVKRKLVWHLRVFLYRSGVVGKRIISHIRHHVQYGHCMATQNIYFFHSCNK